MGKKRTEATVIEPTEPQEPDMPLRLAWMTPEELSDNPANWRRHPSEQVSALNAAVGQVGWAGAALYNERTSRLIDGHCRKKINPEHLVNGKLPVLIGNWTEEQERTILLTLDPLAGLAETDSAALESLMRDVQIADEALAAMVAGMAEDAGIIPPEETVNIVEDVPPEPPVVPVTRPGDLWTIQGANGIEHRLLCADCRDPAAWERLLDGERAALCLTDPPYGIGENYEQTDDTKANLSQLVEAFFPIAKRFSQVVLLTPGNTNQRFYQDPDWTLAWFVPAGTGMNRWGFTCWQPILAYGRDPYLANGLGSRPDALVKTESAENQLSHPCPKPVGVWTWLMERGSINIGDVVVDPFMGSGTGLMAAAHLGRNARGMELVPAYVDVCLRRYVAKYPDADPVRHDGAKWSELQPPTV